MHSSDKNSSMFSLLYYELFICVLGIFLILREQFLKINATFNKVSKYDKKKPRLFLNVYQVSCHVKHCKKKLFNLVLHLPKIIILQRPLLLLTFYGCTYLVYQLNTNCNEENETLKCAFPKQSPRFLLNTAPVVF